MQLSIRLSEQLSERVQVYLDRGLSKSALVTSALDYYLAALESQPAPNSISAVTSDDAVKKVKDRAEEQVESSMPENARKIPRAERRRVDRAKKKGRK
jgi:hypothetical protein